GRHAVRRRPPAGARAHAQAGDGRQDARPRPPYAQVVALFAEVAVEPASSLDRQPYSYSVPEGLDVVPGHRVTVPFGRRNTYGFVVSLGTEDPGVEVKQILEAGQDPLLLPHQVELARLVADHYWVPVIECVRAMLPPRVRAGASTGSGPSSRQKRHSRLLELALGP